MVKKILGRFICENIFQNLICILPVQKIETSDNGRMKVNIGGNYNGDFVHKSIVDASNESTYLSSVTAKFCEEFPVLQCMHFRVRK